eukprot:11449074-Alexandrium_andersonii.AAC.1
MVYKARWHDSVLHTAPLPNWFHRPLPSVRARVILCDVLACCRPKAVNPAATFGAPSQAVPKLERPGSV